MQKRILGYLLTVIGLGGMALAGYIFVTGTGGRGHLIEITSVLIIGASCFFAGINHIYESTRILRWIICRLTGARRNFTDSTAMAHHSYC